MTFKTIVKCNAFAKSCFYCPRTCINSEFGAEIKAALFDVDTHTAKVTDLEIGKIIKIDLLHRVSSVFCLLKDSAHFFSNMKTDTIIVV